GLMDVVTISGEKSKNYRLTFKKGKLTLLEISQDEAKEKLCKITGKSTLRKKLVQLNLHDGRNVVADGEFKTGDTIKISLPTQKIDGVIKLEKGVKCYVSHGKHSGETATLKELVERGGSVATDAKLSIGKNEFITRKEYLFAVDEGFKTK
ncbi:MAG: 30S ribosomal protein S4e, partial [Candidatus Micrarchaeia archaeon]